MKWFKAYSINTWTGLGLQDTLSLRTAENRAEWRRISSLAFRKTKDMATGKIVCVMC